MRIPDPLDVAVGHTFTAAAAGFWTGCVLATLAGLLLGRARFGAVRAWSWLLARLGFRDAALRVLEREARRCRKRARRQRGRAAWLR